MTSRLIILAFALVTASGAASAAATSGGSSSNSTSHSGSAGAGHAGGGASAASGGGHVGAGHLSGALGGRGAAASAHGGALHAEARHAGLITENRHVETGRLTSEPSSKMTGMHHHHREHRYQPRYDVDFNAAAFRTCYYTLDPQSLWRCGGPSKSGAGHGSNPHS